MKKLPSLLMIVSILWLGSGNPAHYKEDHVAGQLIVQLKVSEADSPSKLSGLFEKAFFEADMRLVKILSERMGIFLFEFEQDKSESDLQLLNVVRKNRLVHQAQFNHYVELRETEPDDPNFPDQWALKNTGQLNGVIGADMDATDAWDITTGGVSSLGDTIIIAIIDDGFNLGHDDIDFWENYHEIPSNGIDDDNNGFVDDYRGWNAFSSTGTITSRDHGTHVTGIAGAIGNNGLGVAGINWDAKILPIIGSSNVESIVVEAYGYVYAQRAKYEETNGDLGAYIVVSNCSFGVNYGQPEDYPIWGSMYDSLGQLGILSSGATANMNVNVDEVGDIPTTFDSDYLISVTNTDMKDEKYLAAGWGPVSIDLGAPGKNIYSTRQGNTYGYKTGTSMSAPQVSGAIALMFAAAEPAFLQSYHNNLPAVSLLLKHYILKGVEPIPSLEDSTVTGGRLNINNSIQLMLTHVLECDTDSLKPALIQDSTVTVIFTLENSADLDLSFVTFIDPNADWLSLQPSSGMIAASGSVDISANFDASGLDPGIYITQIEAQNIRGDKVFIEVKMTVLEPAGINERRNDISLIEVYPNPFRSDVNIEVDLAQNGSLRIDILDQRGRAIRNIYQGQVTNGKQVFTWDGCDDNGNALSEGIYYCRVDSEGSVVVKKLLLLY